MGSRSMIPWTCHIPNQQIHKDRKRVGGHQGLEGDGNGENCLTGRGSPFGVMRMLWTSIEVYLYIRINTLRATDVFTVNTEQFI